MVYFNIFPFLYSLPQKHDTIFWYAKEDNYTVNIDEIRIPYNTKTEANYKEGLKGSGTFYDGKIKSDEGILNENGKVPEDWWSDIAIAGRYPKNSPNNIGYPTQKPMALLERIIKCASNEGDLVLDPFVGGGTTIAVADKLKRNWTGIDQSVAAVKVTDLRLRKQQDMFSQPFYLYRSAGGGYSIETQIVSLLDIGNAAELFYYPCFKFKSILISKHIIIVLA